MALRSFLRDMVPWRRSRAPAEPSVRITIEVPQAIPTVAAVDPSPQDILQTGLLTWLLALQEGHVIVAQSPTPEELPHVVTLSRLRRTGEWVGASACGQRRSASWIPVPPHRVARATICGACAEHLRGCAECRAALDESRAMPQVPGDSTAPKA